MDDEIKGEGNSVNYKYRMHDPRIGRFFAVDPLTKDYPHYTPYSFSGNKLIAYRELEGLEEIQSNGEDGHYLGTVSDNGEIMVVNDDKHWNYYNKLKTAYDNRESTVTMFGVQVPVTEENVGLALDRLLENSRRLYTEEELKQGVLEPWFAWNLGRSETQEYAMTVFSKSFIDSDGNPFTGLLAGTTTTEGLRYRSDPLASELEINRMTVYGKLGKYYYHPTTKKKTFTTYNVTNGWKPYAVDHTHPTGKDKLKFSLQDYGFSLEHKVPTYMMAYGYSTLFEFVPGVYSQFNTGNSGVDFRIRNWASGDYQESDFYDYALEKATSRSLNFLDLSKIKQWQ